MQIVLGRNINRITAACNTRRSCQYGVTLWVVKWTRMIGTVIPSITQPEVF